MLDKAQSILDEVSQLINGDRQQQYGHPRKNFENIAHGWSMILEKEVTPRQVALMMAWLKLAREIQGPKRDSLVDACAYFALAEEVTTQWKSL